MQRDQRQIYVIEKNIISLEEMFEQQMQMKKKILQDFIKYGHDNQNLLKSILTYKMEYKENKSVNDWKVLKEYVKISNSIGNAICEIFGTFISQFNQIFQTRCLQIKNYIQFNELKILNQQMNLMIKELQQMKTSYFDQCQKCKSFIKQFYNQPMDMYNESVKKIAREKIVTQIVYLKKYELQYKQKILEIREFNKQYSSSIQCQNQFLQNFELLFSQYIQEMIIKMVYYFQNFFDYAQSIIQKPKKYFELIKLQPFLVNNMKQWNEEQVLKYLNIIQERQFQQTNVFI